jgi:hypothetical protein
VIASKTVAILWFSASGIRGLQGGLLPVDTTIRSPFSGRYVAEPNAYLSSGFVAETEGVDPNPAATSGKPSE